MKTFSLPTIKNCVYYREKQKKTGFTGFSRINRIQNKTSRFKEL
jgi:hypothetical protein